VFLWDVSAGKLLHHLEQAGGHLAFAADGQSLFTLGNLLERWDVATGKPLYADTRPDGHVGAVTAVTFAPHGGAGAARGGGRPRPGAGGRHRLLGRADQLCPPLYTPDGKHLLLAAGLGGLSLREAAGGREVQRFDLPQEPGCHTDVSAARFTPDGRTLFA